MKIEKGKTFERAFTVERNGINDEERTVELAFSSEEPYERSFGTEVLDHEPQSVMLDRLKGGAAVLVNHDTDDQVGVVMDATIDGDKRGRATVKFSRSVRGQEIFQDIQDGIRKLVSVGYSIDKYAITERKGLPDLVRVTQWTPHEISIVPIPADSSVGVGRNAESKPKLTQLETIPMKEENVKAVEKAAPVEAVTVDHTAVRTAEAKRMDAIRSLGGQFDGMDDIVRDAISGGTELADFNKQVSDEIGKRNAAARQNETIAPDATIGKKDADNFSFVRLMDALANPNDRASQSRAGFEFEICSEAEAKLPGDFNVRGAFVPDSITRNLTVAADGSLVGTDHQAGSFIDILRNNMAAYQAGVRMLPGLVGNVDIPRQTGGSSATWVSAEDGDATESEPTFDSISLSPKDLAVYTEMTRRMSQQATPSIEGLVRADLAQAIGLGLDSAIYYGTGATGQPQGIDGATGVNDPTFGVATAPTYAELVTQMTSMMRANAAGNLTYIVSPEVWQTLITSPVQTSGVEGNFIMAGNMVLGRNVIVSTQLAANDFVLGDFSQILCGEWGGYELNTDPYTHSLKGRTRYVVFKTCDLAVRQPTKFSFHNAA